jgi:hypothetical protein
VRGGAGDARRLRGRGRLAGPQPKIALPAGLLEDLMPPLSISAEELTQLVGVTAEAIAAATGAGTPRAPAAVAPASL